MTDYRHTLWHDMLWSHQRQGINVIANASNGSTMLNFEMGTGKTLTALHFLDWNCKNALVVVPKKAYDVWHDHVTRFTEGWQIVDLTTDTIARRVKRIESLNVDNERFIAVVNYDILYRSSVQNALNKVQWDAIIPDESHRIKSHKAKASKFLWRLGKKSGYRICLTGTPTPNSPTDWFGQMRFLDDSVLGTSWTRFRNRYAETYPIPDRPPGVVGIRGYRHLDELADKVAPYIYTVKADEVLDLPDSINITRRADLDAAARHDYDELEKEYILQTRDGIITADNVLVKSLRLRQMTGGIVQTDDGETVVHNDAKAEILRSILEELYPEPVAIFTQFRGEVGIVDRIVQQTYRERPHRLTGRYNDLTAWQGGKGRVLVAQLQAGSEGVDMTRARYTVFYNLPYSLGQYDQARARTRRPGADAHKSVFYYHILCRNTLDEAVYAGLEHKAQINEMLFNYLRDST